MRTLGITLLCTLLAIAISWQSQAEGLMADASPDKGVSFQERPCTTQEYLDAEIQCGIIIVPENYDEPSSKSLHLPAMRIGPMNRDHMAVVVGGGGPGGQALHDDYIQWWASFRENVLGERGILIVEQRGVGEKHSLRCPGLIELSEKIFSQDLTMDEEKDLGAIVARDCYRQFQLAGIDLQQYTTSTSARDFENIRRVLGISKLDLIGESYGGMIAFEMIGTYPDSVRLALLDSPSVPVDQISGFEFEVDLLFSQLADQCNESYSCREYYGDMIQNMTTVLNRLEKAPLRVPYSNWQTLNNESNNSIVLNRDRFATAIILSFYSEDLVDYLPVLLQELAETGDSDSIESYAENLLGYFGDEGFSDGLFDSINCRETVPYIIIEEPQHTGIVWSSVSASEAASLRSHYCEEIWFAGPPIPPKPPKGIVHPILILSGDIDPITPGRISSHLAEKYSSVQHITVPGIHGVFGSICADYLARQFFENPRSEVVIHWDCYRENVWD